MIRNPMLVPVLVTELTKLVQKFQAIEKKLPGPDGIIQSIRITLEKLLFAIINNQMIPPEVRRGLERSCAVAVRTFEGSSIEDDLFRVKDLLMHYVSK